jgi:hypothetical protein
MMLKDLEAFLKFPGDFPTSKVSFDYLDLQNTNPIFVPNKINIQQLSEAI